MKTFKEKLEEIMNVENKRRGEYDSNILEQSFIISRAFGSPTIEATHFLLAILKVSPNSLAVQYLETIQSKEAWKKQWQERLMKANEENPLTSHSKINLGFLIRTLKTIVYEKELLKCESMNENCFLLAILRYQDFDGLVYKDAIQFIKNKSTYSA